MTQTRTFRSVPGAIAGALANVRAALAPARRLRVTGRLDHQGPGAHVVWTVVNQGRAPRTLSQLVLQGPNDSATIIEIEPKLIVKSRDRVALATELDWNVLTARSISLIDSAGKRHPIRHRTLARVRSQLRQMLRGSPPAGSAHDWLYGTANLAFGVVILGLGLFMLLWVLYTG